MADILATFFNLEVAAKIFGPRSVDAGERNGAQRAEQPRVAFQLHPHPPPETPAPP